MNGVISMDKIELETKACIMIAMKSISGAHFDIQKKKKETFNSIES